MDTSRKHEDQAPWASPFGLDLEQRAAWQPDDELLAGFEVLSSNAATLVRGHIQGSGVVPEWEERSGGKVGSGKWR